MNIPAFFFGLPRDVKRRCVRALTAMKRGVPLSDIVGAELLATEDSSALIVLDGPSPVVGGLPQFCMHYLSFVALNNGDRAVHARLFEALVETLWACSRCRGRPRNSV